MATDTRSPGRPRQFDEDAVLDRATEVFWERGYAATSVADLVEATGVHKPSLYRTFGSKDELFARVLRRYVDGRIGSLAQQVRATGSGTDAVRRFLAEIRHDVVDGVANRGCLLVASSSELRGTTPGFEDFGSIYRAALREALEPLVTDTSGTPAEAARRTNVLTTWMLGLDVTVRGGAGPAEIDAAIEAMVAVVDAWD